MESIFKVILGVFVSVMIIFSGFCVLKANNEAMEAEHYLHVAASIISESDFSQSTVRKMTESANAYGYVMQIDYVTKKSEWNEEIVYAILTMEYPYDVPLLGLHTTHKKQITIY